MKDRVVADAKYAVLEERAEMAQLIQRFVLLGALLCFALERISGVQDSVSIKSRCCLWANSNAFRCGMRSGFD